MIKKAGANMTVSDKNAPLDYFLALTGAAILTGYFLCAVHVHLIPGAILSLANTMSVLGAYLFLRERIISDNRIAPCRLLRSAALGVLVTWLILSVASVESHRSDKHLDFNQLMISSLYWVFFVLVALTRIYCNCRTTNTTATATESNYLDK